MFPAELVVVLASFHLADCFSTSNPQFGLKTLPHNVKTAATANVSAFDRQEEKWIELPVDHFNASDKRVFKLKYYQETEGAPGAPIFFFIELLPMYDSFAKSEFMLNMVSETGGALFSPEHRYYGTSQPFDIATTENLKFLSSRQALADFAMLLKEIKSSPRFKSSRVVAIGGLYGGSLASWMRQLYPDLVDAAVAYNAPVLAKTDFFEFLEVAGDDIKNNGLPGCYALMSQIFKSYKRLLKNTKKIEILKTHENICNYTNMNNERNQQWFLESVVEKLTHEIVDGRFGITDMCRYLPYFTNRCDDYLWDEEHECCDYRLNFGIQKIREDRNKLAWFYQRCTEFGFIRTARNTPPFTVNLPKGLYYKICKGLFGADFGAARVEEGVRNTNQMYGGLRPNVTKVVFVNGGLDPWHKLSVVKDLSPDAPAIFVPKGGGFMDFCLHLYKLNSPYSKVADNLKTIVKKWIEVP